MLMNEDFVKIAALFVLALTLIAFGFFINISKTPKTATVTVTTTIDPPDYCSEYATLVMVRELVYGGVVEYQYYARNTILTTALNTVTDLTYEAENSTAQYRAALAAIMEFIKDVNEGDFESAIRPYYIFNANIEYLRILCGVDKP